MKYLRMWQDDPRSVAVSGRTVEQELCGLLEWYICECIPYGPHNLGSWWSDGVVYLEVSQTAAETFKLLGVTWIGCKGLAPFEIDVELNPMDERHFVKTTFRIGMVDDLGRPTTAGRRVSAKQLLDLRPQQNSEWAMAVELTPPSTA